MLFLYNYNINIAIRKNLKNILIFASIAEIFFDLKQNLFRLRFEIEFVLKVYCLKLFLLILMRFTFNWIEHRPESKCQLSRCITYSLKQTQFGTFD